MGAALKRLLAALAFLLSPAAAFAGQNEHLTLALKASSAAVRPGNEFIVGLEQIPQSGWHTYWVNPGDTGYAPIVDWSLPDGVTLKDVRWPTPQAIPYAGGVTFGFDERSTIIFVFEVSDRVASNTKLDLTAHIEDLVCADACEPAYADLTISIPVNAAVKTLSGYGQLADAFHALPLRVAERGVLSAIDGRLIGKLPISAIRRYADPDLLRDASAFNMLESTPGNSAAKPVRFTDSEIIADLGEAAGSAVEVTSVIAAPEGAAVEVRFIAAGAPTNSRFKGGPVLISVVLAFVGGLMLNLMPCVFPILSIKLLALARAPAEAAKARAEAIYYSIGAISTFLTFAFAIEVARYSDASVGWGFQMQSPIVTGLLSIVMLLVALNMSGVFEVGASIQSVAGSLGVRLSFDNRPRLSSFFTGALAVVVSAPCTAPFMAAAIGAAIIQGGFASFAIFASLGAGFALPFVALVFAVSAFPTLASRLPKSGGWMIRLRQILAIPMYAAAAWLFWVFSRQTTLVPLATLALLLIAVAFADRPMRNVIIAVRAFSLASVFAFILWARLAAATSDDEFVSYKSEPYSPEKLNSALNDGAPVLVDMTADWCITCKVNEAGALKDRRVAAAIKKHGVEVLVGDWTDKDAVIADYLRSFGRSGVPMYVLYDREGHPEVLPQLLNPNELLTAIEKTGALPPD